MSAHLAKMEPLRITKTTRHDVRRYEGDVYELLQRMQAEHRTGMLLVFISQGTIFKMEFDTRVKDIDGK